MKLLLDQLRNEYQRNEDEIKAPLQNELRRVNNNYVELWKEKNRIAKLATTDFGRAILREILHEFSNYLEIEFVRVMHDIGKKEVSVIRIPSDYLKFMRFDEFENYCLQAYCQQAEERVNFSVQDNIIDAKIQIITVEIPKITIQRTVAVDEVE